MARSVQRPDSSVVRLANRICMTLGPNLSRIGACVRYSAADHSQVVQLVERRTLNPVVVGSIPTLGATEFRRCSSAAVLVSGRARQRQSVVPAVSSGEGSSGGTASQRCARHVHDW